MLEIINVANITMTTTPKDIYDSDIFKYDEEGAARCLDNCNEKNISMPVQEMTEEVREFYLRYFAGLERRDCPLAKKAREYFNDKQDK